MCEDPYPEIKQEFSLGDPPNRAPESEIEKLDPSTAPPGGEDNRRPKRTTPEEVFLDTGTSVEGFRTSSKQIAGWLGKV